MNIMDCEQLSLDNDWSITRKNACHISNMNTEMGELAMHMQDMFYEIKSISFKQSFIFGIFGLIGLCILGVLVKNYFKK